MEISEELLLVRAILKISSAVDNLDKTTLPRKQFFELQAFDRWFCENTCDFTVAMAHSDWEAYQDITYFWTDILDNSVECCTSSKKYLILFTAKLFSALKDLLRVNEELVAELVKRIRQVINKRFITRLEIDMKDFLHLVGEIDSLFETNLC